MNILELGKVNLHWREDGDPNGRPIVFANSLGTDLRLWDDVLAHLPDGLRLIRFDMRGHGLSSCPTPPFCIDDLVDDTEALLSHLNVKDCVFVGISIGGMLAQALASKRPDLVSGLVLSNTATKIGTRRVWHERIAAVETGGLESIADDIMQRWFGSQFLKKPELGIWREMLLRTSRQGYIGCCHAIADADLTETTKTLTQPAFVLAGGDDLASPPSLVRNLASLLKSSKFHNFEGIGHLPPVETPKAFAASVSEFFKETANV